MKKKLIIRVVIGLVVLLVAGLIVLSLSLGAIVKKGVETIGPSATQADVRLTSAQVSLFGGSAGLNGFFLGNPKGYQTASAVTVAEISVALKPASVLSDKVIIDHVIVKSPVITFEGGLRDNNLTKIEKNLDDYLNGSSPTAPPAAKAGAAPAKSGRKLQVNDLEITGATLQVNTMLSAGKTLTLPLPDLHLTSLGTGPDGITGLEVAKAALNAELKEALEAVAKNAGKLGADALQEGKGAASKGLQSLKGLLH